MINKPDFLKLSPERVAENNQMADSLRRKFNSRLKLSPSEEQRARAMVIEDEQRKSVNSLKTVLSLARKTSREGLAQITAGGVSDAAEQLDIAKDNLAESLAAQGKFLEAAKTTPDKQLKAEYRAISKAIERDDNDLCDCPAPVGVVGNQRLELPKYRIVKKVYSIKHAAEMDLLECTVCGKLNVRTLTPDLVKVQTAAANAADENRISDVELFKN